MNKAIQKLMQQSYTEDLVNAIIELQAKSNRYLDIPERDRSLLEKMDFAQTLELQTKIEAELIYRLAKENANRGMSESRAIAKARDQYPDLFTHKMG